MCRYSPAWLRKTMFVYWYPCSYLSEIGYDHIVETGVWTAGSDNNLEGLWEWANPRDHEYDSITYGNWFQGHNPSGKSSYMYFFFLLYNFVSKLPNLIMSPLPALLFSHLFTVAQHYLESTYAARRYVHIKLCVNFVRRVSI